MKLKKFFSLVIIALLVVITTGCVTPGTGGVTSATYNFTTPQTDKLALTADWEGKDFLADGVGKVSINQSVDGDTVIFKTTKGASFTCRFLGVDTPESTYRVDEWGFAAADFTKLKLKAAETIVLTSDQFEKRKDGNGRYLAWVWYRTTATSQFRLLNLELVEHAFSVAEAAGTQYNEIFNQAELTVKSYKLRVWGEKDKSYDDSEVGISLTIKEIRETYSTLDVAKQNSYKGTVIRTQGIVTRAEGIGSGYLQAYDEETKQYYNVYVYGGFTDSILDKGNVVYIQGKIGYYNGSLQITDLDRENSGVISFPNSDNTIYVKELTGAEYASGADILQAQMVKMKNLTVTDFYNSKTDGVENGGYTLTATTEDGYEVEIHVSSDYRIVINGENDDVRITDGEYFVGRTITEITAAVGFYSFLNKDETAYYPDGMQLILHSGKEIKLAAKAE